MTLECFGFSFHVGRSHVFFLAMIDSRKGWWKLEQVKSMHFLSLDGVLQYQDYFSQGRPEMGCQQVVVAVCLRCATSEVPNRQGKSRFPLMRSELPVGGPLPRYLAGLFYRKEVRL